MKMIQQTVFKSPYEMINTQYGLIKYSEWLSKEKARINSDPDRSSEIRTRGVDIALFVNQVVTSKGPELYRSWKKRKEGVRDVKTNLANFR